MRLFTLDCSHLVEPPEGMEYANMCRRMPATQRPQERPNYGIDAPGVVRNLFLAGIVGVSVWAVTTLGALSGRFHVPKPVLVIAGMGFTTGIGCSLMAIWMVW